MATMATATMLPSAGISELVAGPPLDYSFKELKSVLEMETEEPRSGGKRRSPEQKDATAAGQAETGADASGTSAIAATGSLAGTTGAADATKAIAGGSINPATQSSLLASSGKSMSGAPGQLRPNTSPIIKRKVRKVTIAVKLNNNSIDSITELPQALDFVMDDPMRNLQWIDLSFNLLSTIQAELLDFKQLKALYLHGNHIKSLPSVERLRKLPKLISLTLNGNPIECASFYRRYVVGALPDLRTLDHSTITDDEVKGSQDWFQGHMNRGRERQKRLEEQADDNE
jgi:hypothetical protein